MYRNSALGSYWSVRKTGEEQVYINGVSGKLYSRSHQVMETKTVAKEESPLPIYCPIPVYPVSAVTMSFPKTYPLSLTDLQSLLYPVSLSDMFRFV